MGVSRKKARQIFGKTNISYLAKRTRTCAYQGVRNVRFSENFACFYFLKHSFWDSPFCHFLEEIQYQKLKPLLLFSLTILKKIINTHKYFLHISTILMTGNCKIQFIAIILQVVIAFHCLETCNNYDWNLLQITLLFTLSELMPLIVLTMSF